MLLSILIVNWNSGSLLRACVASVHEALDRSLNGAFEIVVIDNASGDDSIARAGLMRGEVVLRNLYNAGFGAACNEAARVARGEFLLFLNPDCEIRAGSVERCLREFERTDMKVGVCGVALEDGSGSVARTCVRFPDLVSLLGSATGLNVVWPSFAERRMLRWDHASDRSVDHVIGAFYMLRAKTFCSLGGFDERYFVYLEDLDFSLNVRRAGLVTRFLAEPRSFHMGGGVSRQVKAERLFYATRSRLLYAFKHLPHWQAWLHAAVTIFVEPLARSVQCVARRSLADLRFSWRGFAMLYLDLPTLLQTVRRKQSNDPSGAKTTL